MTEIEALDRAAIDVRAQHVLRALLDENPRLDELLRDASDPAEAQVELRTWVEESLGSRPEILALQRNPARDGGAPELSWRDKAAIRLLDTLDHAGRRYPDPNIDDEPALNDPIRQLWLAVHRGTGGAHPDFFRDLLELFRQFRSKSTPPKPGRDEVERWMDRHPSGLDPRIVALREENRERILGVIVDRIDRGEIRSPRYCFPEGAGRGEKLHTARTWWAEPSFHLRFAVRSPELLNEMLGHSLGPETMALLQRAHQRGIPFFVNPYYLSLLQVRVPRFAIGADLAIRSYVLYSQELVDEFGHIRAWEKEDEVQPGRPNAAGWLLPPYDNVHRRYPDVAILIPDNTGRACAGLCSPCQRMYGFQHGQLNFDLEQLAPRKSWPKKLAELMEYFENDSQLRDILITGGDALMATDPALEQVLDAVLEMAERKRRANRSRPPGKKYAEMIRVRLGTRLPAYLPQRIDEDLVDLLARFRQRAVEQGFQQFVVQTHFTSPMEITPQTQRAVQGLLSAGWIVTNQLVFTAAAARRGHVARLRQVLNEIGVLPYYTFAVKGHRENLAHYAPIARLAQEAAEEKTVGQVPPRYVEEIAELASKAPRMVHEVNALRGRTCVPFLATDRSVMNLPAVGKSLSFRTVGITRRGRRILDFEHDPTRAHSPITERMGCVTVVESKSIAAFLRQLRDLGEDPEEYTGLYGYSMGETEPRMSLYEYPSGGEEITSELTNLQLPG